MKSDFPKINGGGFVKDSSIIHNHLRLPSYPL